MKLKSIAMVVGVVAVAGGAGCLSSSHCQYAKRAEAAQTLPRGVAARPGRIYFASFPENRLALSICGWKPNVGHASLLTKDAAGRIAQYDYGWFVGYNGARPSDAIGYVDASESYAASPAPTRPPRDGKDGVQAVISHCASSSKCFDVGLTLEG